ncbi:MAG: L,D-transpeptidase family protein [Candidatus Xenobia bacterium]
MHTTMRLPRRPLLFVALFGAALLATLPLAAVSRVRLTSVTPGARACINTHLLHVAATWRGWVRAADASVDGHAASVHLDSDTRTLSLDADGLSEGTHALHLVLHPSLALCEDVVWDATVTVDTVVPRIHITSPAPHTWLKSSDVQVHGYSKPFSTITATLDGKETPSVQVEANGKFVIPVQAHEGDNALTIVAVDRAGNRSRLALQVQADLTPPQVVSFTPADGATLKTDHPVLAAVVRKSTSGLRRLTLQIDDHPPINLISLARRGDTVIKYPAPELPQGTRTVRLVAENRAGWRTEETRRFLVHSNDNFGEKVLTLGAIGRAASVLQQRLIARGFLTDGHVNQVFDEETLAAVKALQQHYHLKADGVVGGATTAILLPRIIVDLGRYQLVLVDGTVVERRYPICCGQPGHPTPTGEFHVMDMVTNPTWYPPKSPWAANAKIIPPGPDNPLGTRWMGLDNDVVGIHGTNAPYSIGTASSHGCMRMHIKDVEELYKHVHVGMRVTIYRGTEKNEDIKRYWP